MPHSSSCSCLASKQELLQDFSLTKSGDGFTIAEGKAHYAPDVRLEPVHMDIYLKFDESSLKTHKIHAKVVQTILCNQPAKSISFDGVSFEDVQVTSQKKLESRYDGEKIHVTFDEALSKGEKVQVEISYVINQPITGICFNYPKNSHLGDFACTDHETEKARYWLACVDYPVIRTTLDFFITAPTQYQVYANGVQINDQQDKNTTHYRLDYRCPSYLICFAVGDFVTIDHGDVHGIPIKYIGPKGTKTEDLMLCFNYTPQIIAWLEKRLNVPFPFPKYFQVIFPGQGGAMENISLVTWDYHLLLDENFAREYKLLFDTVNIHEATHSYFGDALVIRHFEHVWTKESWATYMESVWLHDVYGKDECDFELYTQAANYMHETKSYVRPIVTRVYDASWDMFDRHTYPGGSWRIHMLRKLLGEEQFWLGVHNYVNSNLQQVVETEDFKRALEKVSGLNLHKFFDQWFYGKGYPIIKGDFKYNADEKLIQITMEQTQVDKKKEIGAFDIDLEVEITCEDQQVETAVLRFTDGQVRASTFVAVSSKPTMVRVDPDMKLLFEMDMNPGEDILLNTFSQAKDIFNRIRAGKQLVKINTKQSINKLLTALKKEPFYGVRAMIAKDFGSNKSPFTAQALASMLQWDEDPRSLMYIANACIDYRDEDIKQAILALLQKQNLGYLTEARALEAYASQNFEDEKAQDDAIEWVWKHIENDKRYSYPIVKRGGYRALGRFAKSKKAYEVLLSRLPHGKERNECRPLIVQSIASVAITLDENVRKDATKLLVDLLRDEEKDLREAAVSGLVTLKAKNTAGAIKSIRNTLAHQYRPWLDRKVIALNKTGEQEKEDVKKLQKDVEDLRDLVKKLQSKLDDLEQKKNDVQK